MHQNHFILLTLLFSHSSRLRYGQLPPIQKMDNTLGTLKACKHLSLSSNAIDRIAGLKGMDSIKSL